VEAQWNVDWVILVSTPERMGMGDHGDFVLPDADRRAIAIVSRWLSAAGLLLVSGTFGRTSAMRRHWICGLDRLQMLFSAFTWLDQRQYR
jgi:hypothetical protein